MAILITGSTGYIGSRLTAKLALQGQPIHLLCRTSPTLPQFQKSNIKVFIGDITDAESIRPALENVDRIYHLAAYARLWAKDASVFQRLNVKGTENVLDEAKKSGVSKIVYTSTAGVIGPSKDKPMTETDPRITGLNVCILNPSRIYGPGLDTGSNPVTKIVELYMKEKWKLIPGNGNDIGSYPYIDDVVNGNISAMERGRSGERYIFGGVNVTFNELMDTIKKYSGIEKKLRHIPFPVLNALSYLMLWNAKLTGKYPMITPDWVAKYKYDWALNSSKAVNELGYTIRPFEEGIKETVEWVKQNRL